jgi:hypothetical protein
MMVQWKLPRINGAVVTFVALERMRVRPERQDDSDSDGETPIDGASLARVYDKWLPVEPEEFAVDSSQRCDGMEPSVSPLPVVSAAEFANVVMTREDYAISKLQSAGDEPGAVDAKLRSLLVRDRVGATPRLLRCADILRSGRILSILDYGRQPAEPDAACMVRNLHPGSHHVFRVRVRNDYGWGPVSLPCEATRMAGK